MVFRQFSIDGCDVTQVKPTQPELSAPALLLLLTHTLSLQITFVAKISNVNQSSNAVSYSFEDGTGTIDVRQWLESVDDDTGRTAGLVVDSLARVVGNPKIFSNRRFVAAVGIHPVTDYNEQQYHLLDAMYTHLVLTRGSLVSSSSSKLLNAFSPNLLIATLLRPRTTRTAGRLHTRLGTPQARPQCPTSPATSQTRPAGRSCSTSQASATPPHCRTQVWTPNRSRATSRAPSNSSCPIWTTSSPRATCTPPQTRRSMSLAVSYFLLLRLVLTLSLSQCPPNGMMGPDNGPFFFKFYEQCSLLMPIDQNKNTMEAYRGSQPGRQRQIYVRLLSNSDQRFLMKASQDTRAFGGLPTNTHQAYAGSRSPDPLRTRRVSPLLFFLTQILALAFARRWCTILPRQLLVLRHLFGQPRLNSCLQTSFTSLSLARSYTLPLRLATRVTGLIEVPNFISVSI